MRLRGLWALRLRQLNVAVFVATLLAFGIAMVSFGNDPWLDDNLAMRALRLTTLWLVLGTPIALLGLYLGIFHDEHLAFMKGLAPRHALLRRLGWNTASDSRRIALVGWCVFVYGLCFPVSMSVISSR